MIIKRSRSLRSTVFKLNVQMKEAFIPACTYGERIKKIKRGFEDKLTNYSITQNLFFRKRFSYVPSVTLLRMIFPKFSV